jgi:hypothetical protein
MKPHFPPVIDLRARLSAATARAEALLDVADVAGIDLDDLEQARRGLAHHEREYSRAGTPWKRREIVRRMDEDIGTLAAGFKRLAAALDRP